MKPSKRGPSTPSWRGQPLAGLAQGGKAISMIASQSGSSSKPVVGSSKGTELSSHTWEFTGDAKDRAVNSAKDLEKIMVSAIVLSILNLWQWQPIGILLYE